MLTALFCDMNAYFASCEQHDRPELQGKPIAVAPVATDLLRPFDAEQMEAYAISTRVNNVRNDAPDLIVPER